MINLPKLPITDEARNDAHITSILQGQVCAAQDLDGGGPGAQAWWEAPCADTKCLGRGWSIKSLVFPRIINICDVILLRHIR